MPWEDTDLASADALDRHERDKERVRLLLARHGILFRELFGRELPVMQWSRLFRALRLMELSGEVLSGHFFRGIHGAQFISHAAFRMLRAGLPDNAVYFLSAVDPASVCGLGLEGLPADLPRRVATSHVVFRGGTPVLVSTKSGRELLIRTEPTDPALPEYFTHIKVALGRAFDAVKSFEIETINGEPAPRSPYREALAAVFNVSSGPRTLVVGRRY